MSSVLETSAPLQPDYLPQTVLDREDEREAMDAVLTGITTNKPQNLFLHGPRGTGKTHLVIKRLRQLPDSITTCYVPGIQCDTQYKTLKQVYAILTGEDIDTGHHTGDLKRKVEHRVQTNRTVIVLDDIDFLLLNDGDDLLYYLSRLSDTLSIITISANYHDLASQVEERTYSSLYPQRIGFEPYTSEELYRILHERAGHALKPHSLHRDALTFIASSTSNVTLGLHWLKTAAEEADGVIREELVDWVAAQAHRSYVDELLDPLSTHHNLVYQGIEELTEEQGPVVRSGDVYTRYQELCETYQEDALSQRRISDYLKHLELLDVIKAEYHYGGNKGKTREIRLTSK